MGSIVIRSFPKKDVAVFWQDAWRWPDLENIFLVQGVNISAQKEDPAHNQDFNHWFQRVSCFKSLLFFLFSMQERGVDLVNRF
jgi:hypothetical protein